jgi:23S rRNA A2030 N6-methylase RlmJ
MKEQTNDAASSPLKPFVIRKLIDFINGIRGAFRKRQYYFVPTITKEQYDRQDAKLGARIELHMDDETWLLEKLGIENHRLVRHSNGYVNRDEVIKLLGLE